MGSKNKRSAPRLHSLNPQSSCCVREFGEGAGGGSARHNARIDIGTQVPKALMEKMKSQGTAKKPCVSPCGELTTTPIERLTATNGKAIVY